MEVLPYAPAETLVQRLLMAAGASPDELPDQVVCRRVSRAALQQRAQLILGVPALTVFREEAGVVEQHAVVIRIQRPQALQ